MTVQPALRVRQSIMICQHINPHQYQLRRNQVNTTNLAHAQTHTLTHKITHKKQHNQTNKNREQRGTSSARPAATVDTTRIVIYRRRRPDETVTTTSTDHQLQQPLTSRTKTHTSNRHALCSLPFFLFFSFFISLFVLFFALTLYIFLFFFFLFLHHVTR